MEPWNTQLNDFLDQYGCAVADMPSEVAVVPVAPLRDADPRRVRELLRVTDCAGDLVGDGVDGAVVIGALRLYRWCLTQDAFLLGLVESKVERAAVVLPTAAATRHPSLSEDDHRALHVAPTGNGSVAVWFTEGPDVTLLGPVMSPVEANRAAQSLRECAAIEGGS